MKRYEYKLVYGYPYRSEKDSGKLSQILNSWGREGWELVCAPTPDPRSVSMTLPAHCFIMKRKLPDDKQQFEKKPD
ncbi:MAG: DUF4177 domain-containing protein [Clostridiales bacterium]|nr:DUF4177 domain-containing protein [Clostridiales bacterium]